MYCNADTALHTKFGKMNEADALAPQCVKSDTRAHTRRATTLLALLALFSLGYWNAFIGTPHHTNSVPRLHFPNKAHKSQPQLLAYTKNQLGYVNAAGNQFKASLWFFSPDGALQEDQLESALAKAICTATSHKGETMHGAFVPLLTSPETQVCEVGCRYREGHPFFGEANFSPKFAYAPGQCSFVHGDKIDAQRTAAVHIPDSEFRQQVIFRLRAFPKQKPRGMAICHGPLYGGSGQALGKAAYTNSPPKFGSWAMHNVDYYSNSGKPGEKPVRSYVFDAREPKLRVLDPLRSALERPEQMELIEMDIPLQPQIEMKSKGAGSFLHMYVSFQLALIRECGDMAKYDGYKWAAFIDYDEYISVSGHKSMEQYTKGLPIGTVSVLIPRVPPPASIMRVPERRSGEKHISFAASWAHTQAQWDVSYMENTTFLPKYIVNLESAEYDAHGAGRPGGIHLPYNAPRGRSWTRWQQVPGLHVADRRSEAVIRHISGSSGGHIDGNETVGMLATTRKSTALQTDGTTYNLITLW